MLPKITLEKFLEIKKILQERLESLQKEYENLDSDKLTQQQQEEIIHDFVEKYCSIQNELFNYDLSDIPFELWEGMAIMSNEYLDFSKTHANLDFSLVDVTSEQGINLKGCNIRNLEHINAPVYSDSIDQHIIEEYPMLFLSDSFPKEFEEKFTKSKLNLEDLLPLTDEQLAELESKKIYNHMRADLGDINYYDASTTTQKIGLKKSIEIYKYNKELFKEICLTENHIRYDREETFMELVKNTPLESLQSELHKMIIEILKEGRLYQFNHKKYSKAFQDEYKKLFPTEETLPRDVVERFTRSELTLEDIIKYNVAFQNVNLDNYSNMDYHYKHLYNILGHNFITIAIVCPNILSKLIEFYSDYSFDSRLNRILEQELVFAAPSSDEELKDLFIKSVLKAKYGEDLDFEHSDNQNIYEDCFYPEWVMETGYYVSKVRDITNFNFLLFLTKETEIVPEKAKRVFEVLGIENIKRFDKETDFFNYYVLRTINELEIDPNMPVATTYDEFLNNLAIIIQNYNPQYSKNELMAALEKIEGPFRERFNTLFIPSDAPEELRNLFYGGKLELEKILRNPTWIPYIKHLPVDKLGLEIEFRIINSEFDFPQAPQPYKLTDFYFQYGTVENLLLFLSKYEKYVKSFSNLIVDINVNNLEEAERALRRSIANLIKNNKSLSFGEEFPEEFKIEHPDLFLPQDAPSSLHWQFYGRYLSITNLSNDKESIKYLKDVNYQFITEIPTHLKIKLPDGEEKEVYIKDIYIDKYGLESLLEFLTSYVPLHSSVNHTTVLEVASLSKEDIEEGFIKQFAKTILLGRYSYKEDLPEHFKQKYPHFFLSKEAPEELKELFYKRNLTLEHVKANPEWITYLKEIHPLLIDGVPFDIGVAIDNGSRFNTVQKIKFSELYVSKFGREAFLKYVSQYGSICKLFSNEAILLKEKTKEEIEAELDKAIYNIILKRNHEYSEDYPEHFKQQYPELFLDKSAPAELKEQFYSRKLTVSFLSKNPEYFDYLKGKDLRIALVSDRFEVLDDDRYTRVNQSLSKILKVVSQEDLLELIKTYGTYLTHCTLSINLYEGENLDVIKEQLEAGIVEQIKLGNFKYLEDAPDFVKKALPDYFLDPTAPEDLKRAYYSKTIGHRELSFSLIKENQKVWLPFLEGKSLKAAFDKLRDYTYKRGALKFVDFFGDRALKIGLQRTEAVEAMIEADKVEVMYEWWLKTGKKFIPDPVIMQNFPIEEADKFLSNGKEWSLLMKNKRFTKDYESKDAMLKLAYCFGVFDNDQQGKKKLDALLNDVPRTLTPFDIESLLSVETQIVNKANYVTEPVANAYQALQNAIKEEGITQDGESIISSLYNKNKDGEYSLTINAQNYPKTREALRCFLEENYIKSVLSPEKAHITFGAFKLIYDKDFREFLLKNLDDFVNNSEYQKYLPAIQEKFQEIKVANSNRVLTAELAISYVEQNKYTNVQDGNEELTRVASMAGYTQSTFEQLQEIYNHGRMRVTSSIPRIDKTLGKYRYEILALTDPLAVAAGTLTNCCQELGNVAEVCMIHSMTSSHGRLFLVRDEYGNVVAQSWVWRNGDVLCFDNIEIPEKAFTRAMRAESGLGRDKFTEEVYQVYKQAAKDLIEEDEKVYKALLESGKITQEQYDGLRLGKVTVGQGYNDIADALNKNASLDRSRVARPLSFKPPVATSRGLYTSDSSVQYILEERSDRKPYSGPTPTVHTDEVRKYDYENFTERELLTLSKLELQTGRDYYDLNANIYDKSSPEAIVQQLARNYETDYVKTRIIMYPNFAIIYEDASEIRLVEFFINNNIPENDKEKALLQIKLALLELQKEGKNINIDQLDDNKKELITSIMNISEEKLDEERGISRGI